MSDPRDVPQNPTELRQSQSPAGERFRFPKRLRLRTQSEFDRVYQNHAYARGPLFNVLVASNERDYSRLGLSVSRHVGNAVERNRWKRLLRESFRLSQSRLPAGLDIIAIPQPDTPPPSLAQVMPEFQAMVRKAHLHLKPKRRHSPDESVSRTPGKKRKKKGKRR